MPALRTTKNKYTLYIVMCADNTLYTGITTDLARRINEHNTSSRGAKYTRSRRPVSVVYSILFRTRGKAQQQESRIKKLNRSQKQALIREYVQ